MEDTTGQFLLKNGKAGLQQSTAKLSRALAQQYFLRPCKNQGTGRFGNFQPENLQTLVVTQLTTNDIRGPKCFVRWRASDNVLLSPIAILIVLVRVLCFGA